MATRADVARRAGVSPSTVSYVLSGARSISTDTKARVIAAIAELDYIPNAAAQALAGRKGRMIAVLDPLERASRNDMVYIRAVTRNAREAGYRPLFWLVDDGDVDEVGQLAKLGIVEGAVIMGVTLGDRRAEVLASSIPVVTMGRADPRPDESCFVDADVDAIAAVTVDHLHGLGHRFVGIVEPAVSAADGPTAAGGRWTGFAARIRTTTALLAACHDNDMTATVGHAVESFLSGRDSVTRLLRQEPRTTAIVVVGAQETAIPGVLQACTDRDAGSNTPMAVVVTDLSGEVADTLSPKPSTVTPDIDRLAYLAVSKLEQLITTPDAQPPSELVPCRLSVRETSTPPADPSRRPAQP